MREPMVRRVDSYEELRRQVDFATLPVPERFNLGVACLDHQEQASPALVMVRPAGPGSSADPSGSSPGPPARYTFGDVRDQVARLANVLRGLGVGRGDVVMIVCPASLETAVTFMATFQMGAIALPVSSLFGPDALRYRLNDSGAKAVVVGADNLTKVREAIAGSGMRPAVVAVGDAGPGEIAYDAALAAASPHFAPADTAAEDPCLLLYTSGTTGNPKGVLHAHRMFFGVLPAIEAVHNFYPQAGDVLWSPADWDWTAGLLVVLLSAWWHGHPVVVDLDTSFVPARALRLMAEHGVTLTLLPPTALRMIRASGLEAAGLSLRTVVSGGEAVGADLRAWAEDFFGCALNEIYGQTEVNATLGTCTAAFDAKPGAIGRPMPGARVAVLDDEGRPVVGTPGEIAVGREHLNTMLGYWNRPEATKFRDGWLLTGDLGEMDTDGHVWFRSRTDDLINSAGYRIGPGESEGCLGSHPAVAMAAVVGVPDERRGEVPKAFVVLRPGVEPRTALAEELRTFVRTRLAAHEAPRDVAFLDDLPRTTTGKIMRRALREAR